VTDGAARARSIAAELLAESRLPESEARERAGLARDPAYWRQLAPTLSIEREPGRREPVLAAGALTAISASIAAHGFFEAPRIIAAEDLALLNHAVDAVTRDRWPAAFAWVYDELWTMARLPDVAAILTAQLGTGYLQIPHVWTHVVAPAVGSSGWAPHFDGEGGRRMSVWIALTDATTSNGCMHLVPRRRLPAAFARDWKAFPEVGIADAVEALHAVRALPVPAGSILGWGFDVLHWGGTCTSAETPRRALSLEFIARDQSPRPDEAPLVDVTGSLPPFQQRLAIVATAVGAYEKFERGLARYRPVAEQLGA
jgi:Phytanoyl-CoA dioxygenase (PhyH)